jgi:hypothetical protein
VVSFLKVFRPESCLHFSFPHACYMPHPYHSWFDHRNNIWWSVQFTKLMQFSPSSLPLRSNYSPQTPSVCVLPSVWETEDCEPKIVGRSTLRMCCADFGRLSAMLCYFVVCINTVNIVLISIQDSSIFVIQDVMKISLTLIHIDTYCFKINSNLCFHCTSLACGRFSWCNRAQSSIHHNWEIISN